MLNTFCPAESRRILDPDQTHQNSPKAFGVTLLRKLLTNMLYVTKSTGLVYWPKQRSYIRRSFPQEQQNIDKTEQLEASRPGPIDKTHFPIAR